MRIPVIWAPVEKTHVPSALAAVITLGVALVVRFMFDALVVYKPKPPRPNLSSWLAPRAPVRTDR